VYQPRQVSVLLPLLRLLQVLLLLLLQRVATTAMRCPRQLVQEHLCSTSSRPSNRNMVLTAAVTKCNMLYPQQGQSLQ
jgi:hypothetical protein